MKTEAIQYWMLGKPQQRAQETKAKEIHIHETCLQFLDLQD